MKTIPIRRRLSLVAVLAVVALTFTACGADGGNDAGSTTTTEASGDNTTTTESDGPTTTESDGPSTSGSVGGIAKDVLIDTYTKMGMSQKQAECAADYLVDKMGDMDGMDDITGLTDLGRDMAKKCDIDPTDLKMPSGN